MDHLQSRLKDLEENSIEKTVKIRLEARIRELENKVELETTSKHRIEVCLFYYINKFYYYPFKFFFNLISGVMVSVLASSAADRGFEPQSGQTKDYNIGICCFSAKHTAFRSKSKDRLSWIEDSV